MYVTSVPSPKIANPYGEVTLSFAQDLHKGKKPVTRASGELPRLGRAPEEPQFMLVELRIFPKSHPDECRENARQNSSPRIF